MMAILRKRPHCARCNSTDVRADAYAEFNVDTGEWELSATFDKGAVCEICGGETRLIWAEVDPQLSPPAPPDPSPMWVVFYSTSDPETEEAHDHWRVCATAEIAQTAYEDAARSLVHFHAGGYGPIRGASEPHYLDGGRAVTNANKPVGSA